MTIFKRKVDVTIVFDDKRIDNPKVKIRYVTFFKA